MTVKTGPAKIRPARPLAMAMEGMKILCIKNHVHSSINDFHERNRVITNPSFAVGRLN